MSATILPFISESVFSPDAVAKMGDAFDRACASAQLEPVVQEVIAARIIALAKAGERDPQVLFVRDQDDPIELPDAFVADLVRSHRADDSSSRGRVRGTPYR